MKKIYGVHMDPHKGDRVKNGETLGRFAARLHNALGGADCPAAFYEVNPAAEFSCWILPALQDSGIALEEAILEDCEAFLPLYARLPSQLIHRDLHLGNLLFQNGEVAGVLDFDIAQKNARRFDLCYLGASLLVGNYTNEERILPAF